MVRRSCLTAIRMMLLAIKVHSINMLIVVIGSVILIVILGCGYRSMFSDSAISMMNHINLFLDNYRLVIELLLISSILILGHTKTYQVA